MTGLPTISVVTPSLNQGQFIEDAVASVLMQEYPSVEHIVVDGCSSDNTLSVLRGYPHLRWISEPDHCQSEALNKGFQMASGDLVGWLNTDEYYLPGALQAVARCATDNPDADIFYGDSIFVDADGRLQRAKRSHEFNPHILLYYGCFIPTDATFFRRRLIDESFLLDTNYRVVMDFEYFARLAAAGKRFKYIKRILGSFRWHGSNLSLQGSRRRSERLQVQRAWSGLTLPDRGYDLLAGLCRLHRGALKLLNGNIGSELESLRWAGLDTRWFEESEGCKTCDALLR